MLVDLCQWLETTWLAALVRESLYGFQVLVALHLLGLTLSVGTLLWFDLRLMGIGLPQCRVSVLYRELAPWFASGFVVMLITGIALFTGFATAASGNLYFRIKLITLLLAGMNALVYHRVLQRTLPAWDGAARPPLPVRLAGLSSLVLWAVVMIAGRMMSYTMF